MKIKYHPALYLTLLICSHLHSQHYFYNDDYYYSPVTIELGGTLGAMNCLTDLGGNSKKGNRKFIKDINWQNSHLCTGTYLSVCYNSWLALRVEANFGKLTADDTTSPDAFRRQRKLHFRTKIREIIGMAEFHPLFLRNPDLYEDPLCSPYITVGIGVFHFNPQALTGNHWTDLQPLRTEGQGFKEYPARQPYQLKQISLPIGGGFRYEVSPILILRFDITYRLLFTDYLDDVSHTYIDPALFYLYYPAEKAAVAKNMSDRSGNAAPGSSRGNPENNDAYFSVNFKAGLIINRQRRK